MYLKKCGKKLSNRRRPIYADLQHSMTTRQELGYFYGRE